MPNIRTVSPDSVKDALSQIYVLVITATDTETSAVHRLLKPLPNYRHILKLYAGNQTYYIGKLGLYGVAHFQCEMGSVSANASLGATVEAINYWSPKAAVMVGIAFGINPEKQRIGDVLLSKSIVPYNIKRVGKKTVIYRSAHPPVSTNLFNRFRNQREWKFKLEDGTQARIIPCDLLSGESLIDNVSFRNELLNHFPTAEGGEMEGVGLFSAAHSAGVQWIVIKAICDYADGKKKTDKLKRQTLAASAATSLCAHVFSALGSLEHLGCVPLVKGKVDGQNDNPKASSTKVNDILFDVYHPPLEDFYYERDLDKTISSILSSGSVWIFGDTGCGKTNLLLRNLYKSGCAFHYLDLSSSVGASVLQIFNALLNDLCEKLNITNGLISKRLQLNTVIKEIARVITHKPDKETFIVIDEIPVSSASFQEFADAAFATLITVTNAKPDLSVKFAFATLGNPSDKLQSFQMKVRQKIRLYNLEPVMNLG